MSDKSETWGKLVYQEPGETPRAIKGNIRVVGDFFEVINERGRFLVSKQYVITVKFSIEGVALEEEKEQAKQK